VDLKLHSVSLAELEEIGHHFGSLTTGLVWLYLRGRAQDSGVAWPRQSTIALGIAKSERSVRDALNELKEAGWISPDGREGRAVRWLLTPPNEAEDRQQSAGLNQETRRDSADNGEATRQKPAALNGYTRQDSAAFEGETRRDSADNGEATRQNSVANPAGFRNSPYIEGNTNKELSPTREPVVGGPAPDSENAGAGDLDDEICAKAQKWLLGQAWWLTEQLNTGATTAREGLTARIVEAYARAKPAKSLPVWCALAVDPEFLGHFNSEPGRWLFGNLDGFASKRWRGTKRDGSPRKLFDAIFAGDVQGAKAALRREMSYAAEQRHTATKAEELRQSAKPKPQPLATPEWRTATAAAGSLRDIEGFFHDEAPGNIADAIAKRDQLTHALAEQLAANRSDLDVEKVCQAALDLFRWGGGQVSASSLQKWLQALALKRDNAAALLPDGISAALLTGEVSAALAALDKNSQAV
jgi:hypothetical protein